MPTKPLRQAASKQSTSGHKKLKLSPESKTRPARKATPPSKASLKARAHAAGPSVTSLSGKAKLPVTKASDPKGKGKSKAFSTTKDDAASKNSSLLKSFKIVAGTYEKLLYGLEGTVSVEDGSHKFDLKPIFIFPAHISCIKAVAVSPNGGKWLATGSADEIIKVWDLRRRKEIGGLMHHEGSITHLEFPSRSHLLSASEDGTLSLFRARDWAVLRLLKGHKGRVNYVAVHPSGKVALSVGKDRTLRMWDLMRGKGSASTKLGKEAELVKWSVDGSMFIVQTLSTIDVYSTNMEKNHTVNHQSRIQDVKFCKTVGGDKEVMLVAAEDKKVTIYEIPPDKEKAPFVVAELVGHANRVKAVATLKVDLSPLPNSQRDWTVLVSTISSDGKIRLYDLAALPSDLTAETPQLAAVSEYDTKGSRLTCMVLADGDVSASNVVGKRKREHEDGEAESDSDEVPEGSEEDEDEQEDNGEAKEEADE